MHRDTVGISDAREGPGTRSDMVLDSSAWSTSVVGKTSPWIDLDSPSEPVRRDSEAALKQEIAWATHLGVPAVCVRLPPRNSNANLARAVNSVVQQSDFVHFWLRLPTAWEEACPSGDAQLRAASDTAPGIAPAAASSFAGSGMLGGAAAGSALPSVAPDSAAYMAAHTLAHRGSGQAATTLPESLSGVDAAGTALPSLPLAPGALCLLPPSAVTEAEEETAALAVVVSVPRMAATSAEKRAFAVAAATSVPMPTRPKADPWQAWNTVRTLTGFSSQVSVCLELTATLPPAEQLRRWLGEPIRAVVVPTHVFKRNKMGFSVLPRPHQVFLTQLIQQRAQIIVSGRPQPLAEGNGVCSANFGPYLEYVHHLASKIPGSSDREDFEEPYHDYLQAPLQPLMDNLESSTYETFEKDPIKYELYEEAVRRALLDTPADKESLVMVVGAGRGPLVRRSLKAAAAAGRAIRMYAVEKNPNAVITLRNLVAEEGWGDRVQVVSHDMRTWEAPEKADILVSELLGSFGDNELSPECLDGAQKFLKAGGISIPASYTSLAAPVMSSKLWNEVRSYKEDKSFETGYVVKMHNFVQLDDPQPCHTFEHPNPSTGPIDNTRYSVNRFVAASAAAVHGFGGYFECVLYKDVVMSINPATHSEGMFSWFPIFFPIKNPIYVSKGDVIELHLWRRVSSTKVWYEWAFTAPDVTEIHNPGGRSYWIGL